LFVADIKMDPSKLFEDLTWADLIIVEGKLKAIQEFDSNVLKHKDLQTESNKLNFN